MCGAWGQGMEGARGGPAPAGAARKGPVSDPSVIEAWLAAGKDLSPEHWAVVFILYRTGIEVQALARITWRDFVAGKLLWKRPKHGETIFVPVPDAELARAVQIYVAGARMSAEKIDRLVRAAARGTGLAELKGASPMTLRLTRGAALLREGSTAQAVAAQLALPPAVVAELARRSGAVAPGSGAAPSSVR